MGLKLSNNAISRLASGITNIKTIYRHGADWLAWTTIVNAAPGPVAQDQLTPEQKAAIEAEIAAIEAGNAVIFTQSSIGGEINGAPLNAYSVNGDQLRRILPAEFVQATIYADGKPICAIGEPNRIVRIPAVLARRWEVKVNGTLEVAEIGLASKARELREI